MKKSIAVLAALAISTVVGVASAEDVSLHVSGGAAESLRAPSDEIFTRNHFGMGLSGSAKVLFKLIPNVAVGPSATAVYLPVASSKEEAGAALWTFGATVRLQGNRETSRVSPYIDVTGGPVVQKSTWNPGLVSSAGIEFSDQTHSFWAGPYVEFNHTFDSLSPANQQTNALNRHDTNVFTLGLSVSFDGPVKPIVHNVAVAVPYPVVVNRLVVEPAVTTTNVTPAPVVSATLHLTETVFFAKNSAELDASAKAVLDNVAAKINANPSNAVVVVGKASAEGDALHNLLLSQQRAGSVVDYLVDSGKVSRTTLTALGIGAIGEVNDVASRNVDFMVRYTR